MICLDELGPLGVGTRPGEEWVDADRRATFEPDYGRRGAPLWVHGAFEPATGQAAILVTTSRDSASHIALWELIITAFPAARWQIIDDNLSTHRGRQTMLALLAWPEIAILPLLPYACWLNLIEPWWKQLKSLGLKGRRFESAAEMERSLYDATDWWNAHRHPYRWKKHPESQLLIPGPSNPLTTIPQNIIISG